MSDVKQVIVIRKDLKMRRGKEIAQGAHASMAFMTRRLHERFRTTPPVVGGGVVTMAEFSEAEWLWITGNFRKIVVTVNSEEELWEIHDKARAGGVKSVQIFDAGLTEFGGVETMTALAIGPDFDEKIDPITGHLTLY